MMRFALSMDDAPTRGPDRSTSYTFALTLIFIAVLVIVAWVVQRNAKNHETTPVINGKPGLLDSSPHVGPDGSPRIPIDDETGKPRSTYQVLTNCRLEDDPGNDGDVFNIVHPQGTHRFSLYWVSTVKVNGGSPESAREFADHFGIQTEDRLRSAGGDAAEFTTNLLRNRPFRIATKWEKDPTGNFLAFVYLDDGSTGLQNLALLLVQNGLAMIKPCSRELPEEKLSAGDFHNLLTMAEDEARRTPAGAWAHK